MKRFLFGIVVGVLLPPALLFWFFRSGHPPVAVADPPLPFEKQIVRVPLSARIEREMKKPAITADAAAFTAGATVYRAQCAACHGLPGRPSSFAANMFPPTPQLFERHGDHVGVSDDEPGESYWKVANGIRLTGMPAFTKTLTDVEVWQVTLLLANADKLPPAVVGQLAAPGTGAR